MKAFLYSFDFLKMRPDNALVVSGMPTSHTYHRAISEPGKQYALYIHHSSERRGSYIAAPGSYREDLIMNLPAGNYLAEWVSPENGSIVSSEKLSHAGGSRKISTPTYAIDIALRMKRAE